MDILYNIVMVAALLIGSPLFVLRFVREKRFRERLRHNLALFEEEKMRLLQDRRPVWFQAASVGEVVAASSIIRECKRQMPHIPIIISSGTTSGVEMAERILPEADAVIFYPSDLPWLPGRVVDRIGPRAFVPVETELWPNFIRAARKRSIPVILVNGRIGERNLNRYKQMRRLFTKMIDTVVLFCMQSTANAQFIIQLGADPRLVAVTGNTKFDQNYTIVNSEEQTQMRKELNFSAEAPILIAGSTHKGEEEILVDAWKQLQNNNPFTRLILAPRDISRCEKIQAEIQKQGVKVKLRSEQTCAKTVEPVSVVLLDTIGELGRFYSIADVVFIGGSLIPHGGHNILEPAVHGKAIVVGPHMFNFKDTYAMFSDRGACMTVLDAEELSEALLQLFSQEGKRNQMGSEALSIVRENRGAAVRTVKLLRDTLDKRGILH